MGERGCPGDRMTLWERANQIIPGGNHLFSKTPDRYCPGRWPPYYEWSKGIECTDKETGKVYQDFSVMGAGNSVLGYCDPYV
jgi:glutamate-1-semialdehyde aminotransferase